MYCPKNNYPMVSGATFRLIGLLQIIDIAISQQSPESARMPQWDISSPYFRSFFAT